MDKLEEIFRMQDALNKRIGVNLPPPTDEEKAKWILNYTRAMQQETAELIDNLRGAYADRFAKAEWMDGPTRKAALAVVRALREGKLTIAPDE